ncbi:MAG: hypothetical protein HUJ75_06380, partial [Parasporobacterium sp.]|nr:hypothetical protein [Parasporobacterium sp.]
DLIITKNKVEASIGNGTGTVVPCIINVKGDAHIKATDEFDLLVIAASVLGAGGVSVGVTAVISIHYNDLKTVIGAGTELTAANVEIKAQGTRNYKVFSAAAGGAGTVAVGVSVAVLLVGRQMSEDEHKQAFYQTGSIQPDDVVKGAADRLDKPNSAGGIELKTNEDADFDVYGNFNPAKTPVKAADDFDEDLDPDSSTSVLGSDQITNNQMSGELAKNTGKNAGESTLIKDTKKLDEGDMSELDANVDKINLNPVSATTVAYKDATSSVVQGGAKITANGSTGSIDIYAGDNLSTILLSGAISGAGLAGVGIGLSVAKLYSTAVADVEKDAVLTANGTISIIAEDGQLNAQSPADKFFDSDDSDRFEGLNGAVTQDGRNPVDIANNTYGGGAPVSDNGSRDVKDHLSKTGMSGEKASNWLFGISVGAAGTAGVGVAGGVFLYWSESYAKMQGNVKNAKDLNVTANLNRGAVHPVIVAIGGGFVGVSVGVAVAITNGKAEAYIGKDSDIEEVTGKITVSSGGKDNSLKVIGGAVAIGAVGVTANIAVANNHDTVKAYIARGAHIGSSAKPITGEIHVIANMKSSIDAILVTVAAGSVAVGATVLVTLNEITTEAFIGDEIFADKATANGVKGGAIYTDNAINVEANQSADTVNSIYSVSGGMVGVTVIVNVATQRSNNYALIRGFDTIKAKGNISVLANISGNTAKLVNVNVSVGAVAAGCTVAVSKIATVNRAIVELYDSAVLTAKDLNVTALLPEGENCTSQIKLFTLSVGYVAVTVSVLYSRNKVENTAMFIVGKNSEAQLSGNLNVIARGAVASKTRSDMPVSVAGLALGATVMTSKVDSAFNANVTMNGGTVTAAGNIIVESTYSNKTKAEAKIGEDTFKGLALAVGSIKLYYTIAENLVKNNAKITGSGKLKGKRLKVNAKAEADSEAYTGNPSTIALASLTIIFAKSVSKADNRAVVEGRDASGRLELIVSDDDGEGRAKDYGSLENDADIDKHIYNFDKDDTIGDLIVNAVSSGTAKSQSISNLAGSLISVTTGSIEAVVGQWNSAAKKYDSHSTVATLGKYLDVTKAGHIIVNADNTSDAFSRMLSGLVISGINVQKSEVPAYVYDSTEAKLEANASINSDGSVAVLAYDVAKADTLIDGTSAGILVNAENKFAKNTVNQNIKADVSANVKVRAKEGILVRTDGYINSRADTHSNSGGLFSGGTLHADNNITRTSTAIVATNAELYADYKDIVIQALAGSKDQINTLARGSGGGLLGIGLLKSNTNISSEVAIHISSGAKIENIFNNVVIGAIGSIGYSRT